MKGSFVADCATQLAKSYIGKRTIVQNLLAAAEKKDNCPKCVRNSGKKHDRPKFARRRGKGTSVHVVVGRLGRQAHCKWSRVQFSKISGM